MKTYYERLKYFKTSTMSNVNTIELLTNEMFHIEYPELAKEHLNAMDFDSPELFKKIKLKTDKLIDILKGEENENL